MDTQWQLKTFAIQHSSEMQDCLESDLHNVLPTFIRCYLPSLYPHSVIGHFCCFNGSTVQKCSIRLLELQIWWTNGQEVMVEL